MAIPKFDNNPIFSSSISEESDDSGDILTEGVLWLPDYGYIQQKLHFEGENGDRYLAHGFPDRQWIFKGILSAPSLDELDQLFKGIQDEIDDANNNPTTYHSLVDSFGHTYASAQVHKMTISNCHITDTGGYVADIVVTGVVQGMHEEASDEESGA